MYRHRVFFSQHYGLISIAAIIPILITAIAAAIVCFGISMKLTESMQLRSDNLAVDNAFVQAQSVLYAEFQKMLSNRYIQPDFSVGSASKTNPVINFDSAVIKEIEDSNEKVFLNAYIIDENYSVSWMPNAQKLGIKKRGTEMLETPEGSSINKYYALLVEIKPKYEINRIKYVYSTEIALCLKNGMLSVKRLYTQKKQLIE